MILSQKNLLKLTSFLGCFLLLVTSFVSVAEAQEYVRGTRSIHEMAVTTTTTSTVSGCTNSAAINYNPYASQDNGSCMYAQEIVPDDFVWGSACSRVFNDYVSQGDENAEVTLWQKFLNFGFNEQIPETGYFGEKTFGGVKRFQEFFAGAILTPWGLTEGTGEVFQTTRSWANRITGCPEQAFEVEGKTVNHATYAIPRGYEFLQTFGTPYATGYTTQATSVTVPQTTTVVVPQTTTVVVPATTSVPAVTTTTVATGDEEIDLLLQAILDVENKIESLNE